MAGLDCNRSEVIQDCLERLVGKLEALGGGGVANFQELDVFLL